MFGRGFERVIRKQEVGQIIAFLYTKWSNKVRQTQRKCLSGETSDL